MSCKILIIDDNEGDRNLIQESLSDAGVECEYVSADTGESAIEKVLHEKPDIIILDTHLPGIDGFETCRQIKALEGINVKVIMMTGVVDAVDVAKARSAMADEYCVKTSDGAPIIESVKKFLSHG